MGRKRAAVTTMLRVALGGETRRICASCAGADCADVQWRSRIDFTRREPAALGRRAWKRRMTSSTSTTTGAASEHQHRQHVHAAPTPRDRSWRSLAAQWLLLCLDRHLRLELAEQRAAALGLSPLPLRLAGTGFIGTRIGDAGDALGEVRKRGDALVALAHFGERLAELGRPATASLASKGSRKSILRSIEPSKSLRLISITAACWILLATTITWVCGAFDLNQLRMRIASRADGERQLGHHHGHLHVGDQVRMLDQHRARQIDHGALEGGADLLLELDRRRRRRSSSASGSALRR